MTDPYRPDSFDPTRSGSADPSVGYPPYVDPAYASQLPQYGFGYPPPGTANPTQISPRYGGPGQPPSGGPVVGGGESGPPEPPRSPRWLWLLAGAAVLLVVGLVIALVIANGAAKKPNTISRLPTMPSTAPTAVPTTQIPSPTNRSPAPGTSTAPTAVPPPTESTAPGVAQTVVYSVTGDGRAISIAYIDTGGVLQTEFNVVLPWRKQVSLEPPASKAASVTVVNIGAQVTCSVSVDGAQVRQRTGTILTICAGS
ncbi:MAG TPA: MmpS family transport accessory protein [Mycobacterium sp.]|nr:MmpS family transport accessory protein [Mycobacterium sp.]